MGIEDELNEDHGSTAEDEDLSDMWNEMNFALESSKVLLEDFCLFFYRCYAGSYLRLFLFSMIRVSLLFPFSFLPFSLLFCY